MPTTSNHSNGRRRGRLIAIGGAEDPDEKDMRILPHVVKRAGGEKARILINAGPTTHPSKTLRAYQRVFERIGVADTLTMSMNSRDAANSDRAVETLERATCVFFTGGDQLRLTSVMSGSRFGRRLAELFEKGLLIAGSSAGATALAGTMIIGGGGERVGRECVDLAPGLGFWSETVIDTHFNREGRVHRLMTAIAMNPGVLGVGLDEDTAVEVTPRAGLTVIGRGNVFLFDGRIDHSNIADVVENEAVSLIGTRLHVLSHGYGMDLTTLKPIVPEPTPADKPDAS
jgi:cyanophycinase